MHTRTHTRTHANPRVCTVDVDAQTLTTFQGQTAVEEVLTPIIPNLQARRLWPAAF